MAAASRGCGCGPGGRWGTHRPGSWGPAAPRSLAGDRGGPRPCLGNWQGPRRQFLGGGGDRYIPVCLYTHTHVYKSIHVSEFKTCVHRSRGALGVWTPPHTCLIHGAEVILAGNPPVRCLLKGKQWQEKHFFLSGPSKLPTTGGRGTSFPVPHPHHHPKKAHVFRKLTPDRLANTRNFDRKKCIILKSVSKKRKTT